MASGRVITGYSYPYYTKREQSTADSAKELARGVDVNISIETDDDIYFYANNRKVETGAIGGFAGGTLDLTIDGLKTNVIKDLFSVTADGSGTDPDGYIYKKGDTPATVAFGCIVRTQEDNATKYHYLILPKVVFSIPDDVAATQEEDIEFQTTNLSGEIYADYYTHTTSEEPDDYGMWKYLSKEYATETACQTALETKIVTYSTHISE